MYLTPYPNDVIKIVSIYIVDSPQIFNLVLVDLMSRQRKFRRPDSRVRERVLHISLIFATLPVKSILHESQISFVCVRV